jgi:hypothetical protein
MDRLQAVLKECLPRQAEVLAASTSRNSHSDLNAHDQQLQLKQQQRSMLLRRLKLHGLDYGNFEIEDDTQERLLTWLEQMDTGTVPTLESVKLKDIFDGPRTARAFRHLATLAGLKEFSLGRYALDGGQEALQREVDVIVRKQTESRRFSNQPRLPYQPPQLLCLYDPFAELKRCSMHFYPGTMSLFVRLLPALERLTIKMVGSDETEGPLTEDISEISKLKQLRSLSIDCYGFFRLSPTGLLHLRDLKTLQSLDTRRGRGGVGDRVAASTYVKARNLDARPNERHTA